MMKMRFLEDGVGMGWDGFDFTVDGFKGRWEDGMK